MYELQSSYHFRRTVAAHIAAVRCAVTVCVQLCLGYRAGNVTICWE